MFPLIQDLRSLKVAAHFMFEGNWLAVGFPLIQDLRSLKENLFSKEARMERLFPLIQDLRSLKALIMFQT